MTESQITSEFVLWLRTHHPTVLFCATCGGINATIAQKVKMKREGYNKGIPDLMIYVARGGSHGLAIEMKTSVGRLTPEQEEWQRRLWAEGWVAKVCRSVEEAKQVFNEYYDPW